MTPCVVIGNVPYKKQAAANLYYPYHECSEHINRYMHVVNNDIPS